MTKLRYFVLLLAVAVLGSACHRIEEWPDNPEGNFDALWSVFDTHYCFFEQRGVDWDSVYAVYRPKVTPKTTQTELFKICSDMINELRDGHVNLTAPFATSYYKKWWSDYPQNYNQRLVEQYYLNFSGMSKGALTYAVLADSVAYVRYSSFASVPSDQTLDWMLSLLRNCRGMVFDIRNNGGGDVSGVSTIVSHFIDKPMIAGYIQHKTGPGHNEFSKPFAYEIQPSGGVHWRKPVVVLTNRSTFSAANNFASVVKYVPGITLMGDCTGGGSGMPFGSELPCGWSVRMSASPVYDCQMQLTDHGVEPDIRVDLDPQAALQGHDTMLDRAIEFIQKGR